MSFSSGTFSLVAGNPVVTGTTISSTVQNNTMNDVATGLTTCILKDGSQTTTAAIPFVTGIIAGSTTMAVFNTVATTINAFGAATTLNIGASTGTITLANATVAAKAITASGTITGNAAMLSPITNSLSGDVALNNTANFFDGPSVAQGTSGTWFASGTVCVYDSNALADFNAKLWDGTTVIASVDATAFAANDGIPISLSGFITSPAGNLRISVKDKSSTGGQIAFNLSGLSKDSTITAVRIG